MENHEPTQAASYKPAHGPSGLRHGPHQRQVTPPPKLLVWIPKGGAHWPTSPVGSRALYASQSPRPGAHLGADPLQPEKRQCHHLEGAAGMAVSTPWTICCSVTHSCLTLCGPTDCSAPGFPSFTVSKSLLKLMSIELVMPSNHLILCHPRVLLPSIFPSIKVFSNETVLHIRWPKCWSFSFGVSPSKEYSGFISFRMDWLTLKSLLQHHSSKESALSLLYGPTLNIQT